ncbi:HAD family hydrolase [Vibrio astriarenae]|uniref:HAD family hydrolase n=1 Tax=Vibrio astriarenae TaxID=1481923 RepID=UPI003736D787
MTNNQPIECVIFDCDGTLIDSEKLCLQAICQTMEELDIHVDYQWLKEKFQGIKIHIVFDYLLEKNGKRDEQDLEALITRYREHCNALFVQHLQPLDGVRDVIAELNSRGLAMCIASNAPMEKMDVTLAITDLRKEFEGRIYSAFDAKAWKPDPKMLHYVLDNMGFEPQQCLFIDDSMAGVEAGVRAQIKTLYFSHDASVDTENPFDVDTITHISECLDYLT